MERTKSKSIEIPARSPASSATVERCAPGTASSADRALSFPDRDASESGVQAWPTEDGTATCPPTQLLNIAEVEDRTDMRRSKIYRLIALRHFSAPIHLGGSKWIAAEADEFIERKKDERDRQRGENKFTPRPAILTAQGSALNGSFSGSKPGSPTALPPSTIRILGPEMVEALRLLKIDIPEPSLDPAAWNVSLAVVKVELASASREKKDSKRKKR